MDALFREQRDSREKLLAGMKYAEAVGAFEGACTSRGTLSPAGRLHHVHAEPVGFCRVCQRAISRIIDLYSRSN